MLPAKYAIYTVGSVWQGGKYSEERLLTDCWTNQSDEGITQKENLD
ncbi:hypothetical protein [Sedimentibacter sp.]|nr:hypothetical protein [Sedimentibacter sp.]